MEEKRNKNTAADSPGKSNVNEKSFAISRRHMMQVWALSNRENLPKTGFLHCILRVFQLKLGNTISMGVFLVLAVDCIQTLEVLNKTKFKQLQEEDF